MSVQDFCDDMMSMMGAADVVLAMGGYNTVCELLTLRKRALLVPRIKPGVEQCIRAERMSALGLVRMLHPDALTAEQLLAAQPQCAVVILTLYDEPANREQAERIGVSAFIGKEKPVGALADAIRKW